MRPLKMEISAFGPFAGREVLNFEDLGERSFFLIHGPTGSGKTTILDAMCFALYGDTSGAERTGDQMCCAFAGPEAMTQVVFDFSMGEKRYQVCRKPQRKRPKKRGEGFTVEQAKAELFDITGMEEESDFGEAVASGWQNVTAKVESILGFKSDQFRQVVMLPQGKFRQLLMADSKERQGILEVLFKTERYSRIESYMKQQAKTLEEEIRNKERAKTILLGQAGVNDLGDLEEKIEETVLKLSEILKEITESEVRLEEAQKRLEEGNRAQEKLADYEEACRKLKELENKKPDMDSLREETLKAKKAVNLNPQEILLENSRKEQEKAQAEFHKCQEQVKNCQINLKQAQDKFEQLKEKEPEREKKAARLALLQDMLPKVISLGETEKLLKEAKKRESQINDKLKEIKKVIEEKDLTLKEKTELLNEGKIIKSKLAILERECQDARTKYEKRQELDEKRKLRDRFKEDYASAEAKTNEQENKYQEIKKELSRLQELWNSGQAAILADTLQPEVPCPVCGSKSHPQPALKIESLPSEAKLKKMQQETEKGELLLNDLKDKTAKIYLSLVQAEGKVEEIEKALGADSATSPETLAESLHKSEMIFREAKEKADGLILLEEEVGLIQKEREKSQEDYEKLTVQMETARGEVISIQAALEEREKAIPENLRNGKSVEAEIKKNKKEITDFDQYLTQGRNALSEGERNFAAAEKGLNLAQDNLTQTAEKVILEEKIFLQKIEEAGFLDFSQYQTYKRTEKEIKNNEEVLNNYEGAVQSAMDWVERSGKAAQGLVKPNIEELTGNFEEARKRNQEVNREKGQLDITLKNMQETGESIKKIDSSLKEMEGRYCTLGRLAEVANGKNSLGMTFQRFVLGALLDDVAIAANERLKVMSRGRYLLHRTLDRERVNAAGGLELEVMDNYTGQGRKVVTLSGGESFLASLALALGLAEVVQSYAGGMHLDTVFIDEGFGSLDPDALDYSIRILIDLQKSGRLIGIISHIPELKERIDTRLEVKSGERGSSAKFILS